MENKTEKFKIILEYIKDLSIETPNVAALAFVKKNITNYIMAKMHHQFLIQSMTNLKVRL